MIRFFNGKLLSMADGSMRITDDEVWTNGAEICYVGPAIKDAPNLVREKSRLGKFGQEQLGFTVPPVFEREIDLKGNLLMPGFKNAHAHSGMTFCRSLADDVPLQPWLYDLIFPLEKKLTPERVYLFTKLAIMEYLTSGITAAFDMYFFRYHIAQSAIDCGFRCVLNGAAGLPETVEDEYVRLNSLNPLISFIPGIHAGYTTSLEEMQIIAELVQRHHAPFYTHISETYAQTQECLIQRGMTPTEHYESLGLFDYGGGGYHCVYLSDHDVEIFKKHDLSVVTCPSSNAKLASGVAPLQKYMDSGINLALGTDGPSSNNGLNMFREMYLACVLQKLQCQDASACDAEKILFAAASGGAKAMGLPDCDCIAPGKQADMIVIDMNIPSMRPIIQIPKNLVYSGGMNCIKLTMVAGKVLFENGSFFIGEDPEKIYSAAETELKKMTANT